MGAILGYALIGVVGVAAIAMLFSLAFFIKRFLDSQRYNVPAAYNLIPQVEEC
jgi:hypothetical protein